MDAPPCLFCERRPATTEVGLCGRCFAKKHIRELYHRPQGRWTPEWEAHLLRLTARASARFPLFPESERTINEDADATEGEPESEPRD